MSSPTPSPSSSFDIPLKNNPGNLATIVVSSFLIVSFVITIALITFHHRRQVAQPASTDRSEADIEMQPPPAPPGDGTFRVGQFVEPPTEPESARPRKLKTGERRTIRFADQPVTGGPAVSDLDGFSHQQRREANSENRELMSPQVDDMEIRPNRS